MQERKKITLTSYTLKLTYKKEKGKKIAATTHPQIRLYNQRRKRNTKKTRKRGKNEQAKES